MSEKNYAPLEAMLDTCIKQADNRFDLWINILSGLRISSIAEIGVWKGDFAMHILKNCASVKRYYMIDPWQNIKDWNKPANVDQSTFDQIYKEAMNKTAFAREKVLVLRGRTSDVIDEIADESLDCVYIDGDHTLRGATIDLITAYDKIKPGGYICGDDFCSTIWSHPSKFEPTMVFPFAVYFAEAKGARLFALPYNQFLMIKTYLRDFSFVDLVGYYGDNSLLNQLSPKKYLRLIVSEKIPGPIKNVLRRLLG